MTSPAMGGGVLVALWGMVLALLSVVVVAVPAAAEGAGVMLAQRPDPGVVLPLGRGSVLDAGGEHSCAVTTAGTARCWGSNNNGQAASP